MSYQDSVKRLDDKSAILRIAALVSDASVQVYGPLDHYPLPADWATAYPAVETWVHSSWPSIPGASWISSSYLIGGDVAGNSWRMFTKTFDLCSGAYHIVGTIQVTADNAEEVYLNGVPVGSDGEISGTYHDDHEWNTVLTYGISPVAGTNSLDFIVRNYPGSSSPTSNPTGLIFKATVSHDCPIQVDIDIKPSSDPNCFNINDHGVIPVAILGSADFDVYQIDVDTVKLQGLAVAAKGKADKPLAAYEDVNGDGYTDLVVKIEDVDGKFSQGSGSAKLTGNLLDGTSFEGVDDICITQ